MKALLVAFLTAAFIAIFGGGVWLLFWLLDNHTYFVVNAMAVIIALYVVGFAYTLAHSAVYGDEE